MINFGKYGVIGARAGSGRRGGKKSSMSHFISVLVIELKNAGQAVLREIGCDGDADGRFKMECTTHMLAIAKELHVHDIGTISIDRSQGTVI